MAERPNAAVLKTAVLKGTGGSNPSSSESNLESLKIKILRLFYLPNIFQKIKKKDSFEPKELPIVSRAAKSVHVESIFGCYKGNR